MPFLLLFLLIRHPLGPRTAKLRLPALTRTATWFKPAAAFISQSWPAARAHRRFAAHNRARHRAAFDEEEEAARSPPSADSSPSSELEQRRRAASPSSLRRWCCPASAPVPGLSGREDEDGGPSQPLTFSLRPISAARAPSNVRKGPQGWTVFETPSTPVLQLSACHQDAPAPLHAVAGRSAAPVSRASVDLLHGSIHAA